jgi:hypothetical protein
VNGHCLLPPHPSAFPSNTIAANNTCNLMRILLVDDDQSSSHLLLE